MQTVPLMCEVRQARLAGIIIPVAAVQRQEGKDLVVMLDADNRIEAIDVKTGRVKDGWIEIISGLEERSEAVAKDLGLLKEGELVKVQSKATEGKQVTNRAANLGLIQELLYENII